MNLKVGLCKPYLFIIFLFLNYLNLLSDDYNNRIIFNTFCFNRFNPGILVNNYNNNNKYEIVARWGEIRYDTIGDSIGYTRTSHLEWYEYSQNGYFEKVDSIVTIGGIYSLYGMGDFDDDGLKEMLCQYSGDDEKYNICLFEQANSTEFPKNIVWVSDTTTTGYDMVSTNKLKHDGLDRILGVGIPRISGSYYRYGFYYFNCIWDNNYQINEYLDTLDHMSSYAVCDYLDNNNLTDILLSYNDRRKILWYEGTDLEDTAFTFFNTLEPEYGAMGFKVYPDIDKDGKKEMGVVTVTHAGFIMPYQFNMFEYDTITHEFAQILNYEYYVQTDDMFDAGTWLDYGDVDGDGEIEILFSGGRHYEVWGARGNDDFEREWEWTDPTYKTTISSIKAFDFDYDGIDEIVFTGGGDVGAITYLVEYDKLMMPDTIEFGNTQIGDSIEVERWWKNNTKVGIEIDSVKTDNDVFTAITQIESIMTRDSVEMELKYKSGEIGYDEGWVRVYWGYEDWKWEDSIFVYGGTGMTVGLDSAMASDSRILEKGIDRDDKVTLYFSREMNGMVIDESNIDSIFKLSGGHSWLDGMDSLWSSMWQVSGDKLVVGLSVNVDQPTIKVGDTISVNGSMLKSKLFSMPCSSRIELRGTFFDMSGAGGRLEIKEVTELQGIRVTGCKTIEWSTQTTQGTLTVYDISGRELIREESKASGTHKTNIKHLKNGIYFIKLKTENQSITEKMVKIN